MSDPATTFGQLSVVRRELGDVVIGTLPPAPAGVVTVPLPGATAYLDPTMPDALPAVVVGDEAEASEILDHLFGGETGARAAAATEDGALLPAVRTAAMDRLIRVGLLRWLRSTGTLPLDRAALAFETAVALDNADDLLNEDSGDYPDVIDLAPLAVSLARRLRHAGDSAAWPGLPVLLDDSLTAIARRLSGHHPMREIVEHEADLRAAMRAFGTGALDWDRWDELLTAARPEAAAHAGARPGPSGLAGRGTVDWARVPPGVLDTAEGTIHWWVTPSGSDRLQIHVEVLANREPSTRSLADLIGPEPEAIAALVSLKERERALGLRFRVYVPGFPLPLATAPLAANTDGQLWSGAVEIPAQAIGSDEILIDIHGAGLRGRPHFGRSRVRAEAMRWAARGLSLLRLSLAAGDGLRPGVREPWERARQLYASEAQAGGTDHQLAVRQEARCVSVIVAYLEATGETRTRHLRAELEDLADKTLPQDHQVPDLSDPAWTPTITELGLLAEQGRS